MKITPNLKVEIPEATDAANTPHYLDSGFTTFDSAITTNAAAITTNATAINATIMALDSRVKNLEIIVGGGISTNPFTASFASLSGKAVTGVWNDGQKRIEF